LRQEGVFEGGREVSAQSQKKKKKKKKRGKLFGGNCPGQAEEGRGD